VRLGALLALLQAAAATAALAQVGDTATTAGDTLRLGIGEAARTAAERNAQVEVAEYGTAEARARVAQQRSGLLPQVSAYGQEAQRTLNTATFGIDIPTTPGEPPLFDPNGQVAGPIRTTDFRARVSQTIFDWSAIQRVRGAQAAVAASEAQAAAAREDVARGAAAAYVQAARAQAQLAARQADVALSQELVGIAENMLSAGTGVRLDVTRAQAQLALAQSEVVGARSAANRTRLALLRAANLPLDRPVVLTDTLGMPPASAVPSREEALRTAMENRADVRVIEEQINAAERQLGAIRAESYPTVSLAGDDGWIGTSLGNLLNTYDWAFEVNVPLFNGFRRRAQAQEQQAAVKALEAQRLDLGQQIAYQVQSGLLDLAAARDLVEAARVRLQLAQQETDEARERFRAGVAGSADVVTASLRLTQARTAYVDALASYQAARVQLAAAEGTTTELR
jgi:outer membrane protein TolC